MRAGRGDFTGVTSLTPPVTALRRRNTHRLIPSKYLEGGDSVLTALAERLLRAESSGIVYPSVRRARGTCLACFRPALVYDVRRRARYRFIWQGQASPVIRLEQRFER